MHKFQIILVILLLILNFFLIYKKNIETFGSSYNTNIIKFLTSDNISIKEDGSIGFRKKNGSMSDVLINKGVINIGNNLKIDSNNNLQCGGFNIDKNSVVTNNNNTLKFNPNREISFDNFIYYKNGYLINKYNDNIFIDPSGNINIENYKYTTDGILTTIDNTINVDPSGNNITTSEYTINLKNNSINKKDGNLNIDDINNIKCENIKIGTDLYLNNNKLTNKLNTFSLEQNNIINMNSNKYVYDIKNNDLSGNIGTNFTFNISNSGKNIYGLNNIINNYNGLGSNIYGITKIILEKPDTANTYLNPLHISSIRFYDYNNNVILPNEYNVSFNNMANGQFNINSTTQLQYYDPTQNRTTSYGGPKINSYTLFWNKTINFSGTTFLIESNQYLQTSHNFIGCGIYNAPYIDNIINPILSTSGVTQQYIFTFLTPKFIKYVEIENRKDRFTNRINGAYLKLYGGIQEIFLNKILCLETSLNPLSLIPPNDKILIKEETISETYSLTNYNSIIYPPNYKPIIRYYIQ